MKKKIIIPFLCGIMAAMLCMGCGTDKTVQSGEARSGAEISGTAEKGFQILSGGMVRSYTFDEIIMEDSLSAADIIGNGASVE